MKKYIVIFAFLILSSYFVFSQEFKAGLLGGVLATQVDGDRMSGFYKAGFSGGLFVYRDIGKLSRYQAEILYSMKGSKTSPKSTDPNLWQVSTTNIDISLNYIYKLFETLHFRIGLTPNVLFTSKEYSPTGIEQIPNEAPAFRRFGVIGQAGMTYFFSEKFSLTWTYNYSLYSIRSGDAEIYDISLKEQNNQRHNYMAFIFGYRF